MGTVRNINGIMIICVALMMGLCSNRVVVSGQGMAPEPSSAGYPMPAEGPSSEGYVPPAGGPSSTSDDCMTKLYNMSDCLSYVIEGSNVTKPEKPCCPELAGLVESSPICLCELLGKSDTYGIKIDMSRALKLPSLCGVSTPPLHLCSDMGIPVGSPGHSISPGAAETPGGLAANPSSGNNNGNGASSSPRSSVLVILAALAFAFLPSFFSF